MAKHDLGADFRSVTVTSSLCHRIRVLVGKQLRLVAHSGLSLTAPAAQLAVCLGKSHPSTKKKDMIWEQFLGFGHGLRSD